MEPRRHLLKFGGSTTMHGAPKVILSKSALRRRVWLLIFLCAWAMFVAQTYLVCKRYFSYPKRVSVDLVNEGVPFPSITLCKMVSLDFYLLHRIEQIRYKYKGFGKEEAKQSKEINASLFRNHTSVDELIDYFITTYTDLIKYAMHVTFSAYNYESMSHPGNIFDKLISGRLLLANTEQEKIHKLSTKLEKLIFFCKYERQSCNLKSDFSLKFKPPFFNCFTYTAPNIDQQRANGYPWQKRGIEDGWSAIVLAGQGVLGKLNVDEGTWDVAKRMGLIDEYSASSGSESVRVVIHPPGTEAFALNEGYDIPPGHSVSLALKYRIHERIGVPYGAVH